MIYLQMLYKLIQNTLEPLIAITFFLNFNGAPFWKIITQMETKIIYLTLVMHHD